MKTFNNIKQKLKSLQGKKLKWITAVLGTIHQSVKYKRIVKVFVDRDGDWRRQDGSSQFVSPQLYVRSMNEVRTAVRECWCYEFAPKDGDVVLDVGAGIGDEALVFSELVGSSGTVFAVEAHPSTYRCLEKTVALNYVNNVLCLPMAACDFNGSIGIADGDTFQTSSVVVGTATTLVRARRLDNAAIDGNWRKPTFIKMNIEGAEVAALKGMPDILRDARHIVVSCHDFLAASEDRADLMRTHQEVVKLLEEAGFVVSPPRIDERPWIMYYVYGAKGLASTHDREFNEHSH